MNKNKHLFIRASYALMLTLSCVIAQARGATAGGAAAPAALGIPADTIVPLAVGDAVPDALWHSPLQVTNHAGGMDTVTLSDYRGRVIVLDFWASWCKSCLVTLPKLDSLQGRVGNQAVILPTTYESVTTASTAFAKRGIDLPTLANQRTLPHYFPHRLLPHTVWLSPDGRVAAITDSKAITAARIADVAAGRTANLAPKIDRNLDYPMLLPEALAGSVRAYQLVVEGKLPGYGGETVFRRRGDTVYGRAMTNRPVWHLYRAAAIGLFEARGQAFHPKQCVIRLADSNSVFSMGADRRHFSVDIIVPPDRADSLYTSMLALLNSAMPYRGHIEWRLTPCLVLERATDGAVPPVPPPAHEGARQLTPKALAYRLNNDPGFSPLPAISEIDGHPQITVAYTDGLTPQALRSQLAAQGIALRETTRKLLFFILTDKQS